MRSFFWAESEIKKQIIGECLLSFMIYDAENVIKEQVEK